MFELLEAEGPVSKVTRYQPDSKEEERPQTSGCTPLTDRLMLLDSSTAYHMAFSLRPSAVPDPSPFQPLHDVVGRVDLDTDDGPDADEARQGHGWVASQGSRPDGVDDGDSERARGGSDEEDEGRRRRLLVLEEGRRDKGVPREAREGRGTVSRQSRAHALYGGEGPRC